MDYFERIWAAVPEGAEPENFALRRDYLLANVASGDRVLDIGCGEGAFTAALADAGARPVGVEVATEPLRRARARHPELELHLLDGQLPFAPGSFDVVWAGELLEHLRDPQALLDDVRRVLAGTGRLLLSTPDHPRLLRLRLALSRPAFDAHFDPRSDHLRFFTANTLALVLDDAGFDRPRIERRRQTLLACAPR
ncbi:MAG TPA: class I SAM-dependent methyltransferase [Solirubrobacteraceae bacterium]